MRPEPIEPFLNPVWTVILNRLGKETHTCDYSFKLVPTSRGKICFNHDWIQIWVILTFESKGGIGMMLRIQFPKNGIIEIFYVHNLGEGLGCYHHPHSHPCLHFWKAKKTRPKVKRIFFLLKLRLVRMNIVIYEFLSQVYTSLLIIATSHY